MRSVGVVGLGGSLREESTSRTALQAALDGAAASGAAVELIWIRDLNCRSTLRCTCRRWPHSGWPTPFTAATR